jgi:hypothetical protein
MRAPAHGYRRLGARGTGQPAGQRARSPAPAAKSTWRATASSIDLDVSPREGHAIAPTQQ